jgi:cyclic pyranopterin phosphate synthase
MLTDPYGRPVESIRISVTQRCNLNCFYCHLEGEVARKDNKMTTQEIQRIAEVATSFSIRRFKLTGGEPLVRSDILEIVRRIKAVHHVEEVSMTTNGVLLSQYAEQLKKAGLSRVNISLDTLQPELFKKITGVDALGAVVTGIEAAKKSGLHPIKVNMVLLKGVNENEIPEMIKYANENEIILQIIEFESPVEGELYAKYHTGLVAIEEALKSKARKVVMRQMHHRKKYFLNGGGEVEIVRPMHNTEFCKYCNRIRVTSDGKLKPCLFRNDNLVDILGPIRKGASQEALKALFIKAVNQRKPYFA